MKELLKKWAADGITREAAQAYINRLDEKDGMEPNKINFAYLTWPGDELKIFPEVNTASLGRIWGLEVEGTCWCRWHTDMFKYEELKKWLREGRLLATLKEVEINGSSYEKIRAKYFFTIAGSDNLRYGIPRVEDFEKIFPLLQESSEVLNSLESKGVIAKDWFLNEGYWACDTQNRLVVFDLKKGKVIPLDPERLYELRPIWIKT